MNSVGSESNLAVTCIISLYAQGALVQYNSQFKHFLARAP